MRFQNRAVVLLIVLVLICRQGCSPDSHFSNTNLNFEELQHRANNGDNNALFDLGERYANGHGVARDNVVAYMWYGLAAELSTTEERYQAQRMQLTLDREMFRHQIAEAERLATLWKQQWR